MREILFRAKRVDNGEWVEGYYFIDERDIEDGIIWRDIPQIQQRYGDHFNYFDVDPSTVGQYTGLTDNNGKRIWEGDIIKSVSHLNDHHQKGATEILVVRYWCGNACLCFNNQESGVPIFPFCVGHEIEVIGNIHDNPEELLEVSHV